MAKTTRGKKSAESLTVVPTGIVERPEPPKRLSAEEAQVWCDVVATKPSDWFEADTFPLLEAYCRDEIVLRVLNKLIARFKPIDLNNDEALERYDTLNKMADRKTSRLQSLGRSMRLTQQSRYKAERAATANERNGGADKPWLV